mmetsp:Transcript_51607/g.102520  ORF Transcript_51607/g.102520 Transcript_51607/m.102520 type:complete len:610 (+) Transcript_51607:41-1870(+)|eukprot:CAMPEP_0172669238 /NCGR_PEP_ID=MMETSP1074-20121228/9548_1 /TAXON_ID=2916 /ORGANISM="Ceratium fusus, Strain PA161109" /LENGTH=609 /DNA_ID=CAMNT_0013485987 /DNA_START=31 /DNA_END=1860 /DNA_ORIENTATION=-
MTTEIDHDKEQQIVETFRSFDANQDGIITRDELRNVFLALERHGESWTEAEIDALLDAADVSKDGGIQYTEFVSWVMKEGEKEGQDRKYKRASSMGIDFRIFLPERYNVDIRSRYMVDRFQIGAGCYGKVFVATDKEMPDRRVAVKKVMMTSSKSKPFQDLDKEIKIMKELDHPNICKLLETSTQGCVMYFVMELCEGGELFDRIIERKFITERKSADVLKQVCSALFYAHNKGIAHRDVKPENIVFCSKSPEDWTVKLIDWGLAHHFTGSTMTAAAGSLAYAAPEVIDSDGHSGYTQACDLWSVGVVAYVMICGKPPFWGNREQQLARSKAEKYPFTSAPWDTMKPNPKDFVRSLLKANPARRLTIGEAIAHPWLAEEEQETSDNSEDVLKNMRHFAGACTFEKLCITAVARQIDHHHLRDIYDVFRGLDKNRDGVLSITEVTEGFKTIFGADSQDVQEVAALCEALDSDQSKCIDYTEFCAAGLHQKTFQQDEVLWAAFCSFDSDGSGYIEKTELGELLDIADVRDAWTPEVCQSTAQSFMKDHDADGDGKISFDDYKAIMHAAWNYQRSGDCDCLSPEGARHDVYDLLIALQRLPANPEPSTENTA